MLRKPTRIVFIIAVCSLWATAGGALAYANCPATGPEPAAAKMAPSFSAQLPEQSLAMEDENEASIVGLWQILLVSKGNPGIPDGSVLDFGYATWHSDGTEIMNSSRSPKSGSFCMGVWKKTGRTRYQLNHVGLSWDAEGTTLIGTAHIHQYISVSRSGNSYSGTFTIDQYDTNGSLILHVAGTITGRRITADD